MEEQMLKFRYKGKREYVHGPCMYKEISELIAPRINQSPGVFKMAMHALIRHQCRIIFGEVGEPLPSVAHPSAEFSFSGREKGLLGWLVETDEPVVDRYPYPEDDIVKVSHVEDKIIKIHQEVPFHPIEVLVAINKHLLLMLFPNAKGKWLFTRLELNRLLREDDKTKFEVRLAQNFAFRMTKSLVIVDGGIIGHIYFSQVLK